MSDHLPSTATNSNNHTSSQRIATGEVIEKARSQLLSLTSQLNTSSTSLTARNNSTDSKSSHSLARYSIDQDEPLHMEDLKQITTTTNDILKWAQGLDFLLKDQEGVKTFTKFLKSENISDHSLMFIFACRGLKKRTCTFPPTADWAGKDGNNPVTSHAIQEANNLLKRRIKAIYRSFLRSAGSGNKDVASISLLPITGDCRKRVREAINKSFYPPNIPDNLNHAGEGCFSDVKDPNDLNHLNNELQQPRQSDINIFDEALTQVESYLGRTTYQAFLKSDIFLSKLRSYPPDSSTFNNKSDCYNPIQSSSLSQQQQPNCKIVVPNNTKNMADIVPYYRGTDDLLLPEDDTCHTFAIVDTPQQEVADDSPTITSSVGCLTFPESNLQNAASNPPKGQYYPCSSHVETFNASCESCIKSDIPRGEYFDNKLNQSIISSSLSPPSQNNIYVPEDCLKANVQSRSFPNCNTVALPTAPSYLPTLHEDSELDIESYCSGMAPSGLTQTNNSLSHGSDDFINNHTLYPLQNRLSLVDETYRASSYNIQRPNSLSYGNSHFNPNKYNTNVVPSAAYLDSGGPASDFQISNSETSGSEIFTDFSNFSNFSNFPNSRATFLPRQQPNQATRLSGQFKQYPRNKLQSSHLHVTQNVVQLGSGISADCREPINNPNIATTSSSSHYRNLEDRRIKEMALKNSVNPDPLTFIPKMNQPVNTMPPSDPREFADILISKLNAVLYEKDKDLKLEFSLKNMHLNSGQDFDVECGGDESSQSILDDHVSRVWKDDNSPSHQISTTQHIVGSQQHVIFDKKIDQWLANTQKYAAYNRNMASFSDTFCGGEHVSGPSLQQTPFIPRAGGSDTSIHPSQFQRQNLRPPPSSFETFQPENNYHQNLSGPATGNAAQRASCRRPNENLSTEPRNTRISGRAAYQPHQTSGLKRCSSASSGISSMIGAQGGLCHNNQYWPNHHQQQQDSNNYYSPNVVPMANNNKAAKAQLAMKYNNNRPVAPGYGSSSSACSSLNLQQNTSSNTATGIMETSQPLEYNKHPRSGNTNNAEIKVLPPYRLNQPNHMGNRILKQEGQAMQPLTHIHTQESAAWPNQEAPTYASDYYAGGCPSQACSTNFTFSSSSGAASNYYYDNTSSAFVSEFDDEIAQLTSSGPTGYQKYQKTVKFSSVENELSHPKATAQFNELKHSSNEYSAEQQKVVEDGESDDDAILSRNLDKISADQNYLGSCENLRFNLKNETTGPHTIKVACEDEPTPSMPAYPNTKVVTNFNYHQVQVPMEGTTKSHQLIQPPVTIQKTVIGYYFCNEPVPYRTKINGQDITLRQFKSLLSKKGKYRYFFKTTSDEFQAGGVINEEISDDEQILPLWEGKIFAKVEAIE